MHIEISRHIHQQQLYRSGDFEIQDQETQRQRKRIYLYWHYVSLLVLFWSLTNQPNQSAMKSATFFHLTESIVRKKQFIMHSYKLLYKSQWELSNPKAKFHKRVKVSSIICIIVMINSHTIYQLLLYHDLPELSRVLLIFLKMATCSIVS